jgi:hypothetical protein
MLIVFRLTRALTLIPGDLLLVHPRKMVVASGVESGGEELRLHLLVGLARDLTEQAGSVTTLLAIGSTEFSRPAALPVSVPRPRLGMDGWRGEGSNLQTPGSEVI